MIENLTEAERAVVRLVDCGLSNQQIADKLTKSVRTVENQVASILRKHSCSSRQEYLARRVQTSGDRDMQDGDLPVLERISPDFLDDLSNEYRSGHDVSDPLPSSSQTQAKFLADIEALLTRVLSSEKRSSRKRIAIVGLSRTAIWTAVAAKSNGDDPILVSMHPTAGEYFVNEITRDLKIPLLRGWNGPIREIAPDFIIVSPGIWRGHSALRQAHRDGIPILSEIEYAYRVSKAPIVAISGSNGKSTTALMTYLMLRAAGLDAVLCGQIYWAGYGEGPLIEAAYRASSSQVLVARVSCFDLKFVSQFRPKVAAITNVYPDNIDHNGDFGNYRRVNRRLLRKMTSSDIVVCNAGQEETFPQTSKRLKLLRWAPVGGGADADAFITKDALMICGHRVAFQDLPFSEPANYENALCASLLALGAGANPINKEWILEGLKQFRGIPHRFEQVGTKDGVCFVNNSACTNPSALLHLVRSASGPLKLLVGGVSKGARFEQALRSALNSHHVYLFGRDALEINEALGGHWPVFDQMEDALKAAIVDAVIGDTIMLAPATASLDQFGDFGERGDTFRSLVNECREREPSRAAT